MPSIGINNVLMPKRSPTLFIRCTMHAKNLRLMATGVNLNPRLYYYHMEFRTFAVALSH